MPGKSPTSRRRSIRGSARLGGLIFGVALLAALLGTSAWIQERYQLTRERVSLEKGFRIGNLPSGEFGKVITFGYDTITAHLLWLRSIQVFGGIYRSSREYAPVLHLFDVITTLEPRMVYAYDFGSMVMGEDSNDTEAALKLLDKGMYANPRRYYRIPFLALFQCAFNDDQYKKAKFYQRMAAKCVDAPDWIEGMGIYLDEKMGLYQIAFEKWCKDWFDSVDSGDELMSDMRRKRARISLERWTLAGINEKIEQFKLDNGRGLHHLRELETAGYLKDYEYISWGRLTQMADLAMQSGESLSGNFAQIIQACTVRGVLPDWVDDPEHGFDLNPDTGEAMKLSVIRQVMGGRLSVMRRELARYLEEHGAYPPRIADVPELVKEDGELKYDEPFSGQWTYDPDTGLLRSDRFPDL
ncbi:hypothetical protein JXA32_10900 [Candidatus Sumerlaeota bacterium]|nr:hypothetical protein [Candidatus Sumerlaeota bacterium]